MTNPTRRYLAVITRADVYGAPKGTALAEYVGADMAHSGTVRVWNRARARWNKTLLDAEATGDCADVRGATYADLARYGLTLPAGQVIA